MNDDLDDLFLEGGDELLNAEVCSHCGEVIYLDQRIEWINEENKIAKCPRCGGEVEING
jgi:NAD-dependent SIR2 family protein deacetylase